MSRTTSYFTFHDQSVISGNGNEFIVEKEISNLAVIDSDIMIVEITGTATSGTTYFEIKVTPDGSFFPIAGVRTSDYKLATSTTGTNEVWQFEIAPYYSVRCRVSDVSGGYITIKSRISKNK